MSVDTGADAARRSICDARTESACVRARRPVYKGRCCVDARVSERCPTDTYSSVHVMSRLLLLLLLLLLPTVGIVSSATLNRRSLSVRRCGRRVVGSAGERAIKVGAGTGHLPPAPGHLSPLKTMTYRVLLHLVLKILMILGLTPANLRSHKTCTC